MSACVSCSPAVDSCPSIVAHLRTMVGGGRKSGSKNFRRSLLKDLIAKFLPNGNLLWKAVADEYQRCTGESEPRDGQDIQK